MLCSQWYGHHSPTLGLWHKSMHECSCVCTISIPVFILHDLLHSGSSLFYLHHPQLIHLLTLVKEFYSRRRLSLEPCGQYSHQKSAEQRYEAYCDASSAAVFSRKYGETPSSANPVSYSDNLKSRKGNCTLNQKQAYFVLYHKIINTFLKNNICIL